MAFFPGGLTGFDVVTVEPGHVVKNPKTGEELAVDDERAVVLGRTFYVTEKAAAALRAKV